MKEGIAITADKHSRQAPPLCLYFTPPSPSSFLQLLSARPSSASFTPLILPFLRLKKLALDGWSALTQEHIQVQWSSVVFWVPLSNRNTYNSSRLSAQCYSVSQLDLLSLRGKLFFTALYIKGKTHILTTVTDRNI